MKLIRNALAFSPVLFLLVYSFPTTAGAGKKGRPMAANDHYFSLPNKAITSSSENYFTWNPINPGLEQKLWPWL
jgi:hypothetical protein